MRRRWLGSPSCAGNPDTGSRRHRLASAGETIPRGTSTVPTGGKRIPCRSYRTQAGAVADFLTDLSLIGLHPVLVLMLELIPGSSRTALSCGQIIYREIPKGNPDPDYAVLHGSIALRADGPNAAVMLDSFFGLHPAMPEFARMYKQKQAAAIHAVATSCRDRSHFDGQDVLESGFAGARPGAVRLAQPRTGIFTQG
jgi:hypothetical protein